jgi:hypothetical protein
MAATTTAPAILRVRSRESTCRISVTFNQLLSCALPAAALTGRGRARRYHPAKDAPLTLTVVPVTKAARFIAVILVINYLNYLYRPVGHKNAP